MPEAYQCMFRCLKKPSKYKIVDGTNPLISFVWYARCSKHLYKPRACVSYISANETVDTHDIFAKTYKANVVSLRRRSFRRLTVAGRPFGSRKPLTKDHLSWRGVQLKKGVVRVCKCMAIFDFPARSEHLLISNTKIHWSHILPYPQ